MEYSRAFVLSCAAFLALASAGDAEAQKRKRSAGVPVRVEYVPPKNPEHRYIFERMKSQEALERIRTLLSPVRLPRRLTLRTTGCDGVVNAWYSDGVVEVCYEYIHEAIRNAPKETTPEGVTAAGATFGPIIEVFLHEVGHALFDLLEVPILGREEDAADLLAAYLLLQMGEQDARNLIVGVAYLYALEAKQKSPKLQDFADVHGLPAQRFFNLLCIAYGAKPKLFADVVEKQVLPKNRAEGCEDEYNQAKFAFERLISPHVNQARRRRIEREIKAGRWPKPKLPLAQPPAQ